VFADEIREKRKAFGLTFYELGELLDVNWVTVWRWEHGHIVPNSMTQKGVLKTLEERENVTKPLS
jgi:DNA-binding transcriptional regulator YiaG